MNPTNVVEWYSHRLIQFNILPFAQHRETILRPANGNFVIRGWKVYSTDGVGYLPKRFNFEKTPTHLYRSLATLDQSQLPRQPVELEHFKAYREQFNKQFDRAVRGWDLLIDFDSEYYHVEKESGIDEGIYSRKQIFYALDKKNLSRDELKQWWEVNRTKNLVNYLPEHSFNIAKEEVGLFLKKISPINPRSWLMFSGSKGFHFYIDWVDIQQVFPKITPADLPAIAKRAVKHYATEWGLKHIDLSIYDMRRVARMPYGIHPKTNLVSLPIPKSRLASCELKHFEMEAVFQMNNMYNRGVQKDGTLDGIVKFLEPGLKRERLEVSAREKMPQV